MKKGLFIINIATAILGMNACKTIHSSTKNNSLADAYHNDFLIGTAIDSNQILGKNAEDSKIIATQFNAITPENVMKCENIHPSWNQYNFNLADKYVALGLKNHQYIVGHTLVWHSQLSPFVRKIQSADSMLLFMRQHIETVAGHYANEINSWDVVNEALNEDGSYRKSKYLELLGTDYIPMAFQLAAKYAPKAALYYNDYNIEQPKKRAGVVKIVQAIRAKKYKIDGIGIQGHWHLDQVPFQEIENSLKTYSQLGLQVAFTELDISVLPNPKSFSGADINQNYKGDPTMDPYVNDLPDSISSKLADQYTQLFKLFLKYKNNISRITFWGVNDKQTWLNNFPVHGRTNYPLLFDRNNQPKKVFYALLNLKKR